MSAVLSYPWKAQLLASEHKTSGPLVTWMQAHHLYSLNVKCWLSCTHQWKGSLWHPFCFLSNPRHFPAWLPASSLTHHQWISWTFLTVSPLILMQTRSWRTDILSALSLPVETTTFLSLTVTLVKKAFQPRASFSSESS